MGGKEFRGGSHKGFKKDEQKRSSTCSYFVSSISPTHVFSPLFHSLTLTCTRTCRPQNETNTALYTAVESRKCIKKTENNPTEFKNNWFHFSTTSTTTITTPTPSPTTTTIITTTSTTH